MTALTPAMTVVDPKRTMAEPTPVETTPMGIINGYVMFSDDFVSFTYFIGVNLLTSLN